MGDTSSNRPSKWSPQNIAFLVSAPLLISQSLLPYDAVWVWDSLFLHHILHIRQDLLLCPYSLVGSLLPWFIGFFLVWLLCPICLGVKLIPWGQNPPWLIQKLHHPYTFLCLRLEWENRVLSSNNSCIQKPETLTDFIRSYSLPALIPQGAKMGLYLTRALQRSIHVYAMLSVHRGWPDHAHIVISNNLIPLTCESLFTQGWIYLELGREISLKKRQVPCNAFKLNNLYYLVIYDLNTIPYFGK